MRNRIVWCKLNHLSLRLTLTSLHVASLYIKCLLKWRYTHFYQNPPHKSVWHFRISVTLDHLKVQVKQSGDSLTGKISRRNTGLLSLFESSNRTLPRIGASIRISFAAKLSLISSLKFVILFTFTPVWLYFKTSYCWTLRYINNMCANVEIIKRCI